jgi:hypothetical protein
VKSLDKCRLVNDLAARNVGNVGAARVGLVEKFEFRGREEVGCCLTVEKRLVSKMDSLSIKVVAYVNGTATTKRSISCLRNSCTSSLVVPLYHALGKEPSGSPVPGTM